MDKCKGDAIPAEIGTPSGRAMVAAKFGNCSPDNPYTVQLKGLNPSVQEELDRYHEIERVAGERDRYRG